MSTEVKSIDAVSIPKTVLESAETMEELEDWLLANNHDFISEMRQVKLEEDLKGKGTRLEDLSRKQIASG